VLFHQIDRLLTAQLPQDRTDLTTEPSVEDLPPVLRYDHDVVLAVPPPRGQVPPLGYRLSLQSEGAFPERKSLPFDAAKHAGSLEAPRITRPVAVAS
jgi:hypothetical protein